MTQGLVRTLEIGCIQTWASDNIRFCLVDIYKSLNMYKVGVWGADRQTDGRMGCGQTGVWWSVWWDRGSLGNFCFLFIIIYVSCFAPFCIGMGGMHKLITS